MKNHHIAIVIPVLNEAENIGRCLSAISELDFPAHGLETIVVDNGSSDRTVAIAGEFGVRVLCAHSVPVAALRNLGARHTTADILAFVDADCRVDRAWLRQASKYFDEPLIVAWGAPPRPPEDSTWVQRTWFLVRKKTSPVQEVDWLESMSLFVRKKAFDSVGGFNAALETCEDVDLCYRISGLGKIVSDDGIRAIHDGEAATLGQFFKKELWRGRSNLQGARSHRLLLKELFSLAIPFYYGLVLPIGLWTGFGLNEVLWPVVFLFLLLSPTAMVLTKIYRKTPTCRVVDLCRLSLLIQVYFFARTIAVFRFW